MDFDKELLGDGDEDAHVSIPTKGIAFEEVEAKAAEQHALQVGFASGKQWGGIYHDDNTALTALQDRVWALFNSSNSLYPGVFPGIRKYYPCYQEISPTFSLFLAVPLP